MGLLEALVQQEDLFMHNLQEMVPFPRDQLRTVLAMLFAYPCGFLLKSLPDQPLLKHVFNILVGLLFCVYTLGPMSWIHSFGSSLVVWIMMKVLSPKVSHIYVFVFCMAYLSLSHIYRQYHDYLGWTLDYTGPQMVLTIKLTSLAYSYHDGVLPSKNLTAEQTARAVKRVPNLLEFYGWVYFFPAFLAGPAIEFREYSDYIDMFMFSAEKGKRIPSTLGRSLVVVLQTIATLPFVAIAASFTASYLFTEQYANSSLWHKFWVMHVTSGGTRMKYYFAWYLAETSCVSCGIGYNGRKAAADGQIQWDRCTNAYPLRVEFAQSMRDVTANWNLGTAKWLRNYVYTRIPSKSSSLIMFATYTTSAFWHGFYPGYYIFFIAGAVCTEICREARRRLRPRFVTADDKPIQPYKAIYDFLGWAWLMPQMSFYGFGFMLLSLEGTLSVWRVLRYSGLYTLLAVFILVKLLPKPRTTTTTTATNKKST